MRISDGSSDVCSSDLVQLALDRLDTRFSSFRLGAAFGEFLLELGDEYVVLARQFLHARGFLLGEGTCGRMKLVKLPLEVVGDVRRRERRDEGETLGLRQHGRGRCRLLASTRLDGGDVHPGLGPIVPKPVAPKA